MCKKKKNKGRLWRSEKEEKEEETYLIDAKLQYRVPILSIVTD
jgi:hypothetical protein